MSIRLHLNDLDDVQNFYNSLKKEGKITNKIENEMENESEEIEPQSLELSGFNLEKWINYNNGKYDDYVYNPKIKEDESLYKLEKSMYINNKSNPVTTLYLKIRKNLFDNELPISQQRSINILSAYSNLYPGKEIFGIENQIFDIEQYISELAIFVIYVNTDVKTLGLYLLDMDINLLGDYDDIIEEGEGELINNDLSINYLRLSLIYRYNVKLKHMNDKVENDLKDANIKFENILSKNKINEDIELIREHNNNMEKIKALPCYNDDIKIIKQYYPSIIDSRYDYRPLVYLAIKYDSNFLYHNNEFHNIETGALNVIENISKYPQELLTFAIENRCINLALNIAKNIERNCKPYLKDVSLEKHINNYINEEKSWDPDSDLERKYKKLLKIIEGLNAY